MTYGTHRNQTNETTKGKEAKRPGAGVEISHTMADHHRPPHTQVGTAGKEIVPGIHNPGVINRDIVDHCDNATYGHDFFVPS